MSTVNFSVPEEVKRAFDETFRGRNKSAVIADLMREAVEREQRKKRAHDAWQNVLQRRERAPSITEDEFENARTQGRP